MTAAADRSRHSWREALAVYGKRRVAVMVLLGFSSGLPFTLTGSTLQAWLTESGLSLQAIGLFGLVSIAYGWKFVWSPAIDGIAIPGLSRLVGHRRAWLLIIQLALAAAIAAYALVDPVSDLFAVAAIAVVVAFLSATQDIAVDAFRIESLPQDEQAAGSASFLAAYRIATVVSFTGALGFVSWLEASGAPKNEAWAAGYLMLAALVAIGLLGTLLAREDWAAQAAQFAKPARERFEEAVIRPFRDFVAKDAWLAILALVILYKLGDAFTSELRTTFFLTLGFEKATYATLIWPFGFFSVVIGGFVGGIMANRYGLMRALWIAGLAQMLTNLVFIWPALELPGLVEAIGIVGPDGVKRIDFVALDGGGTASWLASAALCGSIAVENFATGVGGTVFVAYLSKLCGNRAYTATQYALLSSLAGQARIMLSAPAGFVAAGLGWVAYYVIGTLLALPGLLLLWWLWRREKRLAAGSASETP